MFGRDRVAGGGRVRSRLTALTLAAGLAVSGGFVVLTPSTASAQGSDPLGPTIAQLQQFYATAVANTEDAVNGTIGQLQPLLYRAENEPGCLLATVEALLGIGIGPPRVGCLL